MMNRRDAIKTIAVTGAAAVAATTLSSISAWATGKAALSWKDYPAGENGFFRAPVLLSGKQDAILIDGGFTLSDGCAVADAIKASGKRLTTIYVSQSDPDYYFSLAPVKAAFLAARVIAASAAIAAIRGNIDSKLVTGRRAGQKSSMSRISTTASRIPTSRRPTARPYTCAAPRKQPDSRDRSARTGGADLAPS